MSPRCRTLGMAAAAAAILLVPAFGQNPGGATTGGGTSGSRPATTTNSTPTSPTNNGGLNQSSIARPMRVSGRVVMDDGSPLGFPATIERVCNGNRHAEGYTDSEGSFSLTLGQHPDVIADASETPASTRPSLSPGGGQVTMSPGMSSNSTPAANAANSDRRYDSCDLVASLSGYTSDKVNLTGRTSLDNPDIGNIVLHRLGGSPAATTVTATSLRAPKAARKALDRGLELAKKNKPQDAIASLQDAVKIDPEFAFAWCELGKLQVANDHLPDAHESFAAAVKAEPRWPEPYLHLAVMAVNAHDWREVADTTYHVLKLNAFQYPQAYFLHGAASFNLHQLDMAEQDALAAEKLDIDHEYPQVEKLLGAIYSARHRYADAAEKLRSYLLWAPDADDVTAVRRRLTEMEAAAASSSNVAQRKAQ